MYSGKVKQLASIQEDRRLDSALDTAISNFIDYWTNGFNPYVGKDVVTSYPNPPEGHRHIHILPISFPSKKEIHNRSHLKYTDSEECWDNWAKNKETSLFLSLDEKLNRLPTSNFCLYYFVDDSRNAYLFHYSVSDAHDEMNSAEFIALVKKVETTLYSKGIYFMCIQDQQELFSSK